MKNYYIVGSGLQGCLSAFHLLKNNVPPENISIFEKNSKLFPGWEYEMIEGNSVFLGFQGFELPRAQFTLDLIIELLGEVSGSFRPNKRYISINSESCLFTCGFEKWPRILKDSLLPSPGEFDFQPNDLKDFFLKYQSTPFFNLIKKCSMRYSDNWLESIRFFYPWFFPREFQVMDTSDEGMYFQSQVRNGSISSNYFFPSDGFELLSNQIISTLKSSGITFFQDHDGLELLDTADISDSIIWTASSLPFLKYFSIDYSLKRQFIQSLLFSTEYSLSSSACPNATEILTIDNELPLMSRISFPSLQSNSTFTQSQLIQVEFFNSDDQGLSEQSISSATQCIKSILNLPTLDFIGKSKPRAIYQFDSDTSNLEYRLRDAAAKIAALQIPLVYWGPINMAKVSSAVRDIII